MSDVVWYVAYTAAKKESDAGRKLRAYGFDTYAPFVTYWSRQRHKRVKVSRVAFPRYLFIGAHAGCSWRGVEAVEEIGWVLRNDGAYVEVRGDVIAGLRKAEWLGRLEDKPAHSIVPGSVVRFVSGAFEGLTECCESAGPRERALVLVEFLNRKISVNVGLDEIVHVSANSASGHPALCVVSIVGGTQATGVV